MNLLVLQETDWINIDIHQKHQLMDRMALRGNEIIDHLHTLLPGERKRSIAKIKLMIVGEGDIMRTQICLSGGYHGG